MIAQDGHDTLASRQSFELFLLSPTPFQSFNPPTTSPSTHQHPTADPPTTFPTILFSTSTPDSRSRFIKPKAYGYARHDDDDDYGFIGAQNIVLIKFFSKLTTKACRFHVKTNRSMSQSLFREDSSPIQTHWGRQFTKPYYFIYI